MFTKQARQYNQWADDNDKLKAKKAAELSDRDKEMINKYEADDENREMNRMDADMYGEGQDSKFQYQVNQLLSPEQIQGIKSLIPGVVIDADELPFSGWSIFINSSDASEISQDLLSGLSKLGFSIKPFEDEGKFYYYLKPINNESIDLKRWAKLAGINENEESGNDKWSSEDGREIKWLNPTNPNETLYDVEEDETITKGEYYNDNVLGRDSDETQPNYGTKINGKWNFSWDSGEIEGFVEGEDFEFV
jgi:hypothetical protein